MRKLPLTLALAAFAFFEANAQHTRSLDTENIKSVQTVCMEDPLLAPVMDMDTWRVEIGFDEMSHEYKRYRYHIDHCEADWTVSDGIFESDYLAGMNDQLIEDYEKSFNTTQLYTHYSLSLPNSDVRLRLSGNYRVTIYDEDDDDKTPVAVSEFALLDSKMSVGVTSSADTDVDFQRTHQQLSININYGALRVVDPEREIKTLVIQNRRPDRRLWVEPNIRKANGVEFSHHKGLIFPAGNEYHKFELLDVHLVNMNVDNMRWYEPYFHATLYENTPSRNYVYDEDQNGAYVLRNSDDEDSETTSEYAFVHFRLKTPRLTGGSVYVQGDWCNEWPSQDYEMTYDEEAGEYHLAVLLKLGYYNYCFLQAAENKDTGNFEGVSDLTDGNFFQTENEYQVLVYYKEQGGRYDKLVGYAVVSNN